ncbi:MAG: oxidoreductase, partial [Pseudomonadota bacterium]
GVVALGAPLTCRTADAHGSKPHGGPPRAAPAEQKAWGIAGQAAAVTRTVHVEMTDDMRFTPARLTVRLGQTVRFKVRNRGRVLHEFVIGTRAENEAHAALMVKFPDMEHDEPWMAHVPPGRQGEVIWTFNRAGDFEFACLMAGHYQAGMAGLLRVVAPGPASGR